jgi:hypothetical protein
MKILNKIRMSGELESVESVERGGGGGREYSISTTLST